MPAFQDLSESQYAAIVHCQRDAFARCHRDGLPSAGMLESLESVLARFLTRMPEATPLEIVRVGSDSIARLLSTSRTVGARPRHPFGGVAWEPEGIHPKWLRPPAILPRR